MRIAKSKSLVCFATGFNLRFTQRHMMMSSMGLSGRVLTLTGRLSIFRASLACDPDFVDNVQHDWLRALAARDCEIPDWRRQVDVVLAA